MAEQENRKIPDLKSPKLTENGDSKVSGNNQKTDDSVQEEK